MWEGTCKANVGYHQNSAMATCAGPILFLELILQLMRRVLIEVTLATATDHDRDRGGGRLNHE